MCKLLNAEAWRSRRVTECTALAAANWHQIAERCAALSASGHFASVSVANGDDAFDLIGTVPPEPLWHGHGLSARFEGLVSVPPKETGL